jgi:ADP-heptose:LPS heptosyltransferase
MSITKLNPLKRRIFSFFTNSFQNSKRLDEIKNLPKDSTVRVLISRPNHRLGNQLLLTPLIQEIKKQFPNCKIHLVLNGKLSSILFSEYDYIEKVFNLPKKPFNNILSYTGQSINLVSKKYDIAIVGCESSNSSKIFVKLSRAKFKIFNSGVDRLDKPVHIAKLPVYNLNTLLSSTKDFIDYDYPKLSIKLTKEEKEKGNLLIRELFKNDKKTICIFTFATGGKCHSKKWWSTFHKNLKTEFKDFNILEMLPMENVSQIDFESKHFYSRDLREIASMIENSVIFIGADSGMMHLAASTNTTTIGLFNVTNPVMYSPYGNENQSIDTNSMPIDDII